MTVTLYHRLHEFINQFIISWSGNSFLPQSNVKRIIQQFLQSKLKGKKKRLKIGRNVIITVNYHDRIA